MEQYVSLSHILHTLADPFVSGSDAEFLEVNFPLRTVAPASPNAPFDEKLDKFPIPELEKELPKGARFERGGPKGPGAGVGVETVKTESAVSLKALLKRVAADQVGMYVHSLSISFTLSNTRS